VVRVKSPQEDTFDMFKKEELGEIDVYVQKFFSAEDPEEGITIKLVSTGSSHRFIVRGLKNY